MRALTLTQPWAGLVASGIKLVENRPRSIIKREDFGKPFAIHASREIDPTVYDRISKIAPDVLTFDGDRRPMIPCKRDWYRLSRITSAVIAIATIDSMIEGPSRGLGDWIAVDQHRWYFGPVGYVLRDVRALATPVPCRGRQGFWTLADDIKRAVMEQP